MIIFAVSWPAFPYPNPIGAVMFLETGGETRFKPRVVEGVGSHNSIEPDRLILDGQQRLTSLYQAMYSNQVVHTKDTRGYPLKRWYYLDIHKALDPNLDREEAIVSLPEDKIIRNFRAEPVEDYSSPEKEHQAELLPLPLLFDAHTLMQWSMQYIQYDPDRSNERMNRWTTLIKDVLQNIQYYSIPTILLKKSTRKEAVCKVFEKVNTGGVSLTVFELLTATYAADSDDFNLRDDWREREKRLKEPQPEYYGNTKVLSKLQNTDFLQAVTLLASYDRRAGSLRDGFLPEKSPPVTCKRKDILRLRLDEYQNWADRATVGFEKAAKFLFNQKIFEARDLPYQTQVVPLSVILVLLGNEMDKEGVKNKVSKWYWCGVLGELYGSAIETRFAKDVVEVIEWCKGGPEPTTVIDASFAPDRLHSLRSRNSAAYKGLHALLMRDGALDFRSGDLIDVSQYFDEKIDIHHIFPKKWCEDNGIEPKVYNSIINKTAISARSNRVIGGRAPSEYLSRVQNSAGISPERMDEILTTHYINPDKLRQNDFQGFYQDRKETLLNRIEQATGKTISREAVLPADDVVENGELDFE